jgi:hypothetical protein
VTITISPDRGETPAIYKQFIEPHLPPSLANPDSVVLETDGFRLRWKRGAVSLDVTLVLKAEPDG